MTKMRTKVMLTVMAAMSMVAACGMNITPTKPDTTVAAETVETVTDLAHKVNEAVMATEVMTTEETTVEETTEVETAAAEESTEETTAAPKAETTKAETKATPKAETKAAPKAETKAETKAAPKAEAPKAPAPTQAPTQAPAHIHQWKEHKATREEWVPNIVSVPDYETVNITTPYYVCDNCTFKTTNIHEGELHGGDHILNGDDGGHWIEDVVTGTENIQIGSHEEDQGYYQNVEYTDYYYCDCGATK